MLDNYVFLELCQGYLPESIILELLSLSLNRYLFLVNILKSENLIGQTKQIANQSLWWQTKAETGCLITVYQYLNQHNDYQVMERIFLGACQAGNYCLVKTLVNKDKMNKLSPSYNRALYHASQSGNLSLVQYLIDDLGADNLSLGMEGAIKGNQDLILNFLLDKHQPGQLINLKQAINIGRAQSNYGAVTKLYSINQANLEHEKQEAKKLCCSYQKTEPEMTCLNHPTNYYLREDYDPEEEGKRNRNPSTKDDAPSKKKLKTE